MLTAHQKQQAQKKLKLMNQQLAVQDQLKNNIKKSSKIITQTLSNISNDNIKHLDLIKKISNTLIPNKIFGLDTHQSTLAQLCQKIKSQKQKLNRQCISLIQQKQRFQNGIKQIKGTIVNIQKTVKESVDEQLKKRKKIQQDLQTSLDDIRNKIVQFQKESQAFDKQNAQLKQKIDGLKTKLSAIEQNYKVKSDQKEQQVKKQKQQLTERLKLLQIQVQNATQLNKQYSSLQKKNFDNKLSLYLKTKKFPQFGTSFQSSAKTLDSCKEQLIKGVTRLNIAGQTIERCQKQATENNNLLLLEMKKEKERQTKMSQLKKQKQVTRARIIQLQGKIKEKKNSENKSP